MDYESARVGVVKLAYIATVNLLFILLLPFFFLLANPFIMLVDGLVCLIKRDKKQSIMWEEILDDEFIWKR